MLTLESEIRAVTVYRSGAVITREVDLKQPEDGWPSQLRLRGLPLALADQSLRVRLSFPEGGSGLLATDLGLELDWEEPPPPATLDQEALKPLQSEQRRLRGLLESLNQDLSRIESLAPVAPQQPAGQPPAAYGLKPRRALIKMRQKLLEQGVARRAQLNLQLEDVTRRLQEASTLPPAPKLAPLYKAVVVTLRQSGQQHCPAVRLHLSYEQSGARWSPSYTLRFDRDFTLAELSMQAHLCQSTGEDWKGVRLEVSTAEVAAWKELPELASRRIGRQQSAPAKPGWRPAPPNTDTLFADYDRRPGRRAAEPQPLVWREEPPAAPPPPPAVFQQLAPEPVASSEQTVEVMLGTAWSEDEGPPTRAAGMMRRSVEAPQPQPLRTGLVKRGGAKTESLMEVRNMPAPKIAAPQRPGADLMGGGGRPSGSAWQPMQPPQPGPLSNQPTAEQLAFDLLYMPGASEPGRGHLQPRTPLQACLQLWRERFPKPPLDARRLIENALQEARRALHVQAPPRQVFPQALDGFDYLYTGEVVVDLPSDAQFHSVPLLNRQLAAHLLWLVVPKITCDVFRQASLETMPDLAVPTGPVDVYLGTDFLATTQLPNVAPGGNFTLGLGVDQSVRVVRNTGYKESTSGMMTVTAQLRHEVTVEAANQLAREVRLEIQETLPQTDVADIKVKLESCEPNWDPVADKPGIYRWILRIPAGESKKAQLVYSIEMPAKLELVGGNRREE